MSDTAVAFDVRVLRPGASAVETLRLEAASEAELRARLSAAGDVVVGLKRAAAAASANGTPRGVAERRFDVGWWCRELRTLLVAGMTAVEAIETLAATRHDGERARIHAALLEALRQGKSLSKAMAATGAFPAVLVAGVTASERTSTLPAALEDFLRYDGLLRKLRQQLVSAAIYPAVVVTLGGAICLFLLLFVVPRFSRMYADLHGPVSGATEVVLWVSRAVQERWPLLAAAAAGLVLALLAAWRSGLLARAGMAIVDAIPLLARQWREFRLAKLYQALALMVKGGYAFDEALQVCAGLDGGARMAARVAEVRAAIARGRSASVALAEAGLTEVVTERLLAVGERTGSFASVLQVVSDRHAQTFSTFVERATRIVEPLLLLLVALAVGAIVVMMYMPIFDIANSVGVGA
ncbi:MAG: type II secretion system F family protein [Burkholderiaceae bacterium]